MTDSTLIFTKLRISVILGKQFLLYARMGSSVSVPNPESDDIFRIFILGIIFPQELFFLIFSGFESDEVSNISMIGGKLWGVLSLIGSVSKFFDFELSGIGSVEFF